MPVVIEVVARIGDSLVDVAHLAPGATYRLGTAELVTSSSSSFTSSEQQAGLVTITMTRGFRVDTPIPLRRLDPRPVVYAVISLAAHLVVVLIALRFEALERLVARPEPPRYRFAHTLNAPEPDPVPTSPKPADAAANAAQVRPSSGRESRRRGERRGSGPAPTLADALGSVDAAVARAAASVPDIGKALEGAEPIYDTDDVNARGFGGHRWDIDSDPAFATIKTPDGIDLSELAEVASLYGLPPAEKALRRIQIQTALAHKSALRGDCVPSHRIAKWLPRVDAALYKSIYLADAAIAYCLTQPVPPSFIKAEPYQRRQAEPSRDGARPSRPDTLAP